MIETHFNRSLPKDVRKEAYSTLGKWVMGFRKNAEAGPFLVDEELRATLFPNTSKRFVFDPLVHVGGGSVMLILILVITLLLSLPPLVCP